MILITGGTGLVGSHILLHLIESKNLRNGQIRAIYRDHDSIQKTKNLFAHYNKSSLFEVIEWFKADVTDVPLLEKAFEGIDCVYHCAAIISFDQKDEGKMRKINIEGTANIVNLSIANKVTKICHISSTAALGDLAPTETEVTEESQWNPDRSHNDYAISKYGAEMEIWRGQQEGLDVIIVNPGVIIGPGFIDQGSGLLFQRVKKGLSFYSTGITGFIAVTDVAYSCVYLMNSDFKNEKYILIAENNSFKNVLSAIADNLKVKRPSIAVSPIVTEIVWRLDLVASFILRKKRSFTKATAIGSYSQVVFSNEKIKKALDKPLQGIEDYIKSNKFI